MTATRPYRHFGAAEDARLMLMHAADCTLGQIALRTKRSKQSVRSRVLLLARAVRS